jgi:hypothetical protein
VRPDLIANLKRAAGYPSLAFTRRFIDEGRQMIDPWSAKGVQPPELATWAVISRARMWIRLSSG